MKGCLDFLKKSENMKKKSLKNRKYLYGQYNTIRNRLIKHKKCLNS